MFSFQGGDPGSERLRNLPRVMRLVTELRVESTSAYLDQPEAGALNDICPLVLGTWCALLQDQVLQGMRGRVK